MKCAALFEPHARPASGTHSCDLSAGHAEPHRCPVCGERWTRHVVTTTPPVTRESAGDETDRG